MLTYVIQGVVIGVAVTIFMVVTGLI